MKTKKMMTNLIQMMMKLKMIETKAGKRRLVPTAVIVAVLIFQYIPTYGQMKLEERFNIHGYMDMLLLSGKSNVLGNIAYVNTYRVNLQPQFTITPKLSTTILLEGADLFSLDESDNIDDPGIIEWCYLTYAHNDFLKLKAGNFAIPFGIFNERFYASPTQLTSFLPSSVYFQHTYGSDSTTFTSFVFPRNASGLMLFGDLIKFPKHKLNYYAYYTNEAPGGRTVGLGKYLGGRLMFESTTNQFLKFGVSYNSYLVSNKLVNQTTGIDLEMNIGNFQFAGEFVLPQIGKHDTLGQPVQNQYFHGISSYAQVGYTIKDLVTPYVRYDFYDGDLDLSGDYQVIMVGGINIAFHSQVVMKMEAYLTEYEVNTPSNNQIFIGTLAVAF